MQRKNLIKFKLKSCGKSYLFNSYKDEKVFNDIEDISYEIGHFYQVQNDFLDCFGEPGVLQKPGTDIEDGKCTWLATLTMEIGNDQQKEIMKKCYGKNGKFLPNLIRYHFNNAVHVYQYRSGVHQ